MAQNIADLGVKVNVTGEADLQKLGNTADKIGKKFSLLERIANGSSLVFSKLKNNFINLKSASVDASTGLDNFERNLLKSTSAFMQAKKAAKEYNNALEGVALTQEKTAKMVGGDRGAAQANRFNFGNINAQLQDIIVTSQMGMKPLTIGLQQGTQLVYILQQSKAPLADFVAGLKSLISPLSLVVVGITTLLAVGIQMVDWVNVGKNVLNGLGDSFDWVAKNADIFAFSVAAVGTTLIAFNAKAIILTVANLTKLGTVAIATGTKMAASWIIAGGPVTWILTSIAAITAGLIAFSDESENILKVFKEIANKVIGLFAAAFNTIVQGAKWVWEKLKSIVGGEGPAKSLTDTLITSNMELLNKDYMSNIANGISLAASSVAGKLREWSDSLGESDKNADKLEKTIADLKKEYDELAISYQNKINDIQFEKSTRGLTEEQKLVAQINHEYEQEIAKLERKVALKQIDLGLFTQEKTKLDEIRQGLIENSLEQHRYNESVEKFDKVMDYGSSLTKGFFSDMKKGLKDGESAWESFTNAIVNMLDKIQDKMMDIAIDAMFDSFKQSNKAGGGNLLSGIVNSGISYFTTGSSSSVATSATHQAFLRSGAGVKPTMTADGGVFSNGVYSSPTVFKFAKGGKFGIMGEAGPEAVMPLRRGPDGSLGVKADGVGGSNVVVNVINNSNAQARTEQRQTSQGMEIDVMIDEMVGEKLGRPGTSSNSALRAFNNRQLITR